MVRTESPVQDASDNVDCAVDCLLRRRTQRLVQDDAGRWRFFALPGCVVCDLCDLGVPGDQGDQGDLGSVSELRFSQIVGGSKPKQSSGMRITPASTLQPCTDPRTRSRSAGQGVPNCQPALRG